MKGESQSGIKHEYVLTESDERMVLAQARLSKIKKLEWMSKKNPSLGVGFDDVQLTDDEVKKVLENANKTKSTSLFCKKIQAENKERRDADKAKELAEWNADKFFKVMRSRVREQGQELIYNEGNEKLVKAICFRLSSDPRYESDLGFSFRKGLIIRGTPGLGKTFIPSLVADNPICPIQILSMNEITETVRKTGEFLGIKFGTFEFIYLDDLGTEETPVKFFGTEINWFKTWYENFYATAKNKSYRLMVSTNLSFQEIEDKYGFRIRDRMAETFDVLDISGTSLRRK